MVESTINLEQFSTTREGEQPHGGCGSCGSGEGGGERCGNGLEKVYPTTAVRFGFMRYIGEFKHAPEMKFTCGARVVIQTQRGIEIGEQVSLTCGGCDKSVTRDQMREWVKRSGEDAYMFNAGRILREATAADLAENARIKMSSRAKRDVARRFAKEHKLAIKVVDSECLFGGERFIFHFTAEQRVDFRGMVKDLAAEYRTRIEMRQIGARDEARLLADFETCGREVCCKVFLKTLKPISMRMAKLQKATLDPTQVSGRCGRLKCCLRYEHTGYEELDKLLPRRGLRVSSEHGQGVIINRQVLTQLVQIRTDEGTVFSSVLEDLTEIDGKITPAGEALARQIKEAPPPPSEKKTGRRADSGSRPPRKRTGSRSKGRGPQARKSPTDQAQAKKPPINQAKAEAPEVAGKQKPGQEQSGEAAAAPKRRRRRRRRKRNPGDGGPAKQDA